MKNGRVSIVGALPYKKCFCMMDHNILSMKNQYPFRKKDSIEHRSSLIPSASMLISELKRFFYERDLLRLSMSRSYKAEFCGILRRSRLFSVSEN